VLRILRNFLPLGVLVLGGCGWQLQGTAKLPEIMSVTYIETHDRFSDLYRALEQDLESAGARVTSDETKATATVRVLDEKAGQRVLSVTAQNSPAEYEVFYSIEYSVRTPKGELISPQKLELTRDYTYDETKMLAKEHEQAILQEALARDLASLVLRRVRSL
jgi:LPS-assembly lipoprotein